MAHWMQNAVKHPGALTRKAKAAGMSTQAFAKKEAHDPKASTKTKRQANLALTFAKARHGGRSKSRKSSR